ncbi:hypothetical protein BX616_006539 [Lobosporangium transversale]|nr:hypothetical protein BX616_006539 [Lobosporangium transversale]
MTEHQYQQFRKADIIEKVCVRIASTFASNVNSSCYVSLQDIQDVFPDALRFKLDGDPIPFLIDPNGNRIEPLRIAFYPYKILDVITDVPQPSDSNNGSNATIRLPTLKNSANLVSQDPLSPLLKLIECLSSFTLTDAQKETIVFNFEKAEKLLLEASEKDAKIALLETKEKDNKLVNLLEVREYNDKIVSLLLEIKEKDDKIVSLLSEAKEKDVEMLKLQDKMLGLLSGTREKDDRMQSQALNRLASLQKRAHAILSQNFELHECPFPRLFIILPVDRPRWDSADVLKNKFRLHFLCESGGHTTMPGKSSQSQIHITKHDGYEVRDCTGIVRKYGKYMLILLHWLKLGMPSSASSAPDSSLIDIGTDCLMGYMDALSKKHPDLNNINTIDDYEGLERAELRELRTFLRTNNDDRQIDDLYRVATGTGHFKWVCLDHYRPTLKEQEQKAFESAVMANGGKYDAYIGKVIVTLESRTKAEKFFTILTNARRVYELDITFDWDWTEVELEAFENVLKVSSVSILRLGLQWFQASEGSASRELLSIFMRYEILVRIIGLCKMKMIHIVLSPDLIKLLNLQPKRSSHLHRLSFEMSFRGIGASELLVLINSLKTNKALTILDLGYNSIGNDGVVALSEALKVNKTLTALDMKYNFIGDEEALALSKALETNTTLTALNLECNSIGKEGILALSEALKVNTTLSTLNLGTNSLGKEEALALAEALTTNTALISLCLSWNPIGNGGAVALAEALMVNNTLTTLNLGFNAFGTEGALALAEALATNTALTTVDLKGNSIGIEGAFALSEALQFNVALTLYT